MLSFVVARAVRTYPHPPLLPPLWVRGRDGKGLSDHLASPPAAVLELPYTPPWPS